MKYLIPLLLILSFNLNAAIVSSVGNPAGTVIAFAGVACPTGYLAADGTSELKTAYPSLYAAIGTAHGTADGTHFNRPDYRGRFLRGVDGAVGNDPDKATRTAMNTGGATGNNVGSVQADALQGHDHTGGSGGYAGTTAGGVTNFSGDSAATGSYRTSGMADDRSGASGALRKTSETRVKNAYVTYCIKF